MKKTREGLGQRLAGEFPILDLEMLTIAKKLGVLPEGATLMELKPKVYSQMIVAHTLSYAKDLGYLPKDAGREALTAEVRCKMVRDGNWVYFLPDGRAVGWASPVLEGRLYRPPYKIL